MLTAIGLPVIKKRSFNFLFIPPKRVASSKDEATNFSSQTFIRRFR